MTLDDLVAQACRRAGVGPDDVLRDQAPDLVNQAMREFSMRHQAGWDWLHRTVTLTLTADQTEYAWSAIEALVADNVELETHLYPLVRIRAIEAVFANGQRHPFSRWAKADLDDRCRHGWASEGRVLYIWPKPSADETLELRVLIGERTLVAGDDSPLCPDLFLGGVIHLARALLYEEKQDDDRAMAARKQYEAEVTRAIGYSRPTGGPGRLTQGPL